MNTDWIVEAMPAAEQAEVRELIEAAHAAGWTELGIWDGYRKDPETGEMEPAPITKSDLFGVEPRTGFCEQVTAGTIERSKVPLSPEAQAENDKIWEDLRADLAKRLEEGDGEREDQREGEGQG